MKTIKILAVAVLAITITSCGNQGVTNKPLKTEIDSVSYALGVDVAYKIKTSFSDVKKELYIQGFSDGMDSLNVKLDDKELSSIITSYFKKRSEIRRADAEKGKAVKFGKIKKAGEAFLAKNKSKKGVITTKSGLQYIVLKKGNGKRPTAQSRVKIHYHGTSIDGKVFDSSVDRKQPYENVASGFVKGFTEALLLMKKGAKYKVFIPQELGYGANQRGATIKPYMALVFEVELLEVK